MTRADLERERAALVRILESEQGRPIRGDALIASIKRLDLLLGLSDHAVSVASVEMGAVLREHDAEVRREP